MSWLVTDLLVDGETEDITVASSSSTSPAQQVFFY